MGKIKFSSYMKKWLKTYYTSHLNVGKNGDFYTSISIGNAFGKLIAIKISEYLKNQDEPLQVVEIGANDGQMLLDIALFLKKYLNNQDFSKLSFCIQEPLKSLQKIQKQTFARNNIKLYHKNEFDNAIFVCNELFDAMPVELYDNEKMAYIKDDKICFLKADEAISKKAKELNISKGEIMIGAEDFIKKIKAKRFTFIGFDYAKSNLNEFSIRAFKDHKMLDIFQEDLSALFGVSDITYSIDFEQFFHIIQKYGYFKKDFKKQSVALVELINIATKDNKQHLLTNEPNFYQQIKHLTYMMDMFYFFEFNNFDS